MAGSRRTRKPVLPELLGLSKLEKKLDIESVDISQYKAGASVPTISTGVLTTDLIFGGGFPVGRLSTVSGKEGSGKSTALYASLRDLLFDEYGKPKDTNTFIAFFDYEGTLTVDYLARVMNVDEMVLRKLIRQGDVFRYYKPDTGNEGLMLIQKICKNLPRFRKIDNKWYQVHAAKLPKEQEKRIRETCEIDEKVSKAAGRLCVPVPKPYAQAVFFIDSWAAMLPSEVEDDMDSNKPGVQASMFSKYLRGIKPMLSSRFCTIIGVNQIRERPMVMYGSPEYEPGGNALQFYSDLRARLNQCSNPAAGKTGRIEEETSMHGGKDRYTFSKITTIKNKVFSPHRTAHVRIWFEADGQPAMGFDPVYDVINYMKLTGQLSVRAGKYKFSVVDTEEKPLKTFALNGKAVEYAKLKSLIITVRNNPVEAYKNLGLKNKKIHAAIKKAGGVEKASKNKTIVKAIRELIDPVYIGRKQLESGQAFELYFEASA